MSKQKDQIFELKNNILCRFYKTTKSLDSGGEISLENLEIKDPVKLLEYFPETEELGILFSRSPKYGVGNKYNVVKFVKVKDIFTQMNTDPSYLARLSTFIKNYVPISISESEEPATPEILESALQKVGVCKKINEAIIIVPKDIVPSPEDLD